MDVQNVDDNNSAINISDVIEVIETDTTYDSMQPMSSSPYVKVVEQPAPKSLRFCNEYDGRCSGILGVNSTTEVKTYPAIQIVGYNGRAVVVVSCVTIDPPYRAHPYNLVGMDGCKRGVCSLEISGENMTATFPNLGIQRVKNDNIEEALKIREEMRVDPFRTGFAHQTQISVIDLSSVRLCFQTFLEGPQKGKFTRPLAPVVSEPIYDQNFEYNLIEMESQNVDNNSTLNISDVIEVIETDTSYNSIQTRRPSAYVRIVEQPASKALRFRYECEGRSGGIPGVNSTPEVKTYPTIQIVGYKGRAVVVVSCVTKDPPYRPHPHNLVGKEGCKKGVYSVEVSGDNMTATFANLGIQCVKKKNIEEALKIREEMRVDPFRTGFGHKTQSSAIDLNSVRLCFQTFLEGSQKGKFTKPLIPVVSDPIYDKKAIADLIICKLSHFSASVAGGENVILLCEKVAKEDISVRFFEEKDGQIFWEGYGDFTSNDVHKQTAIAFRSPRYKSLEIEEPVQVFIQLRRPSDGMTSEAVPFEITPLSDPDFLKRKRRKLSSESDLRKISEMEQMIGSSTSPNPCLLVMPQQISKLSPIYASRTPSPHDLYQQQYGALGATSLSQATPMPIYMSYEVNTDHEQPGTQLLSGATNILNMDTQEFSLELNLNPIDSRDLADIGMIDDGTLSNTLSASLILDDQNQNQQFTNSTDSLTKLATSTYNDLCYQ